MGYFLLQFAFVAIPALLSFTIVYHIVAQIKTNRRRNIFFLLSCVVPLAITILSVFAIVHNPLPHVDVLGLWFAAWFVMLIGLGVIVGAVAAFIIWRRKKCGRQDGET